MCEHHHAAKHILCSQCDMLVALPRLEHGQKAACPRCGTTLTVAWDAPRQRPTAYALAALFMLLLSNLFPFVNMRVEFYSNDLGTFRGSHGPIKRFTYAMTRGSLQDGAGSNAIWNITNVTRSDRHFLYTTPAWAKAQSEDKEVISYIKEHGESPLSILHPYYACLLYTSPSPRD